MAKVVIAAASFVLPNIEKNVEECDATMKNSSNKARFIKRIARLTS